MAELELGDRQEKRKKYTMLNVSVIFPKTNVVFRERRALGLVTRNKGKMFQRTYKCEVKSKLYVWNIMQSRATGLLYRGDEIRREKSAVRFYSGRSYANYRLPQYDTWSGR
jgi:hypothetical protein